MRLRKPIQPTPAYPLFIFADMSRNTRDELELGLAMYERILAHHEAKLAGLIDDYSVDWCNTQEWKKKLVDGDKDIIAMIKSEIDRRDKPQLFTA